MFYSLGVLYVYVRAVMDVVFSVCMFVMFVTRGAVGDHLLAV